MSQALWHLPVISYQSKLIDINILRPEELWQATSSQKPICWRTNLQFEPRFAKFRGTHMWWNSKAARWVQSVTLALSWPWKLWSLLAWLLACLKFRFTKVGTATVEPCASDLESYKLKGCSKRWCWQQTTKLFKIDFDLRYRAKSQIHN